MLKNNVTKDLKKLMIEENMTQRDVAEAMGVSRPYITSLVSGGSTFVNANFLKMLDTLGYDLELRYVPKK